MEWTREQRYKRLEDEKIEVIDQLEKIVSKSPWRQAFHIQPNTGLLNDPNGFAYYNGEYHLFYQWFPLGPVHGLKYWYHTKSKNLVNWENVGIAIKPYDEFDRHGAYSGSAIEHNGKLHLMYTGNTRDENWVRHPYQCMASLDSKGNMAKWSQPVIASVPAGYTDHFRDPKVWEENGRFYAVIGAQRTDQTGCVVLYSSWDLQEWKWEGEIQTKLPDFGYMWECPDYFELQEKGILLFCPQGVSPEGDRYQNIYQSGYVMGEKLDLASRKLTHGEFHELDLGFDFYAPQTMQDPQGRRILVGWMGLPEIAYPTDAHGWAHCLTIPRQLMVRDDKLIQQPVEEMSLLRKNWVETEDVICGQSKSYEGFRGRTYEMICEFENQDAVEFGVEFRANADDERTILKYDARTKKVILDRAHSGERVGASYGTTRQCTLDSPTIKFQLFVDVSSVEIFVNDGEAVLTSRIFPHPDSQEIRFFAAGGAVKIRSTKWDYE